MKDYYELMLSVYAKDTQAFIDFVTKEFLIAHDCKLKSMKTRMFRVIKEQLLLVYSIKVEGVNGTPSEIVELLDTINSFLENN